MQDKLKNIIGIIIIRLWMVAAVLMVSGAFFVPGFVPGVLAHEILPAIVDVHSDDSVSGDGRFDISIKLNAEAMLAGIGAEHDDTDKSPQAATYNELRRLGPDQLSKRFEEFKAEFIESLGIQFDGKPALIDGVTIVVPPVGDVSIVRSSTISVKGDLPNDASSFRWAWPLEYGASVVRMNQAGDEVGQGYSAYLSAGQASEEIALKSGKQEGLWEVVRNYTIIGFEHILPKGLDHILFVIGLFLLSTNWKVLVWQISAFTVAHTITLALASLGYVQVSPAIVEPLIAASIIYIGVENLLTEKLGSWRTVIIFCFGLLHGLGFAGVLGEIGLAPGYYLAGLIAFNFGVELGQLTVIAICYLAFGMWFGQKTWYRSHISNPLSIAIALIACWWFYERVFLG